MQSPTTYHTSPRDNMGIWPFTSEKEAAQNEVMRDYDWAYYRAMAPHISIWESMSIFLNGGAGVRLFFQRYMNIAESYGPYTPEIFDTVYKPQLSAYYKPDILKIMLDVLLEMYSKNELPEVLYNPAGVDLSEDSPIVQAFKAVKEGTQGAGNRILIYALAGGVAIAGAYGFMSRRK